MYYLDTKCLRASADILLKRPLESAEGAARLMKECADELDFLHHKISELEKQCKIEETTKNVNNGF